MDIEDSKGPNYLPKIKIQSSPVLQKMQSLHMTNMKNIFKCHQQTYKTIQNFLKSKQNYLNTVQIRKQQKVKQVYQTIHAKVNHLVKINMNKTKKHEELYKTYRSNSQQKIRTIHIRQSNKIEQAQLRKLKHTQAVKLLKKSQKDKRYIKYLKEKMEESNSQILYRSTVQRLQNAFTNRKNIYRQKTRMSQGRIDYSIWKARQYVNNLQQQKQKKYLLKSIQKIKTTDQHIEKLREISRSKSIHSKKSKDQKNKRAQSNKKQKQNKEIQKLQKQLQEKMNKIETVNNKRGYNLFQFTSTLKKSRQLLQNKIAAHSQIKQKQEEDKSKQILQVSHQKWMFLTGLKQEKQSKKQKNLYQINQAALRA